MALPFIFDYQKGETPESIKRKRELALALMGHIGAPKNVGEGLTALGAGIGAAISRARADKAEQAGLSEAQKLFGGLMDGGTFNPFAGGFNSTGTMDAGTPTEYAGLPTETAPYDTSSVGGDVYSGFMDTVRAGGVENPYALAAIAATGMAESRFSPQNVTRTWSDPSESGQPGRAGGIMSWRGPRLEALASTGDLSPQGQARFFLQENPELIERLNAAGSVEEAQRLMNNAWKFAGYDKPSREAARRLSYAKGFLPKFASQAGTEVASLDPSIGMPAANPPSAGPVRVPPPPQAPQVNPAAMGSAVPQPPPIMPVASLPMPGMTPQSQPQQPQANPDPWGGMRRPGQVPQVPQQVAQATPPPMLNQQRQQQMPQMDVSKLYQILAHPFATPEMKAIATMQLKQMQDAQAQQREAQSWIFQKNYEADLQRRQKQYEIQQERADPEYQLRLRKLQAETENLGKIDGVVIGNRLVDRHNGNVIYEATEGYRLASPEEAAQYGAEYGQFDEGGKFYPLTKQKPQEPDLVELYDERTGMPYKARWNEKTQSYDKVGGVKAPTGTQLRVDPATGEFTFQQGTGLKPLTEADSKNTVFATRAKGALPTIDELGGALTNPAMHLAENIPLFGNYMLSEDYQLAKTAGLEFLQAVLRKDTGAAITKEETTEYGGVYLPQPGDGDKRLAYKKEARSRALKAIEAGMSPDAILRMEKALEKKAGAGDEGQTGIPEGLTKEEWNIMTPEEKSLWLK